MPALGLGVIGDYVAAYCLSNSRPSGLLPASTLRRPGQHQMEDRLVALRGIGREHDDGTNAKVFIASTSALEVVIAGMPPAASMGDYCAAVFTLSTTHDSPALRIMAPNYTHEITYILSVLKVQQDVQRTSAFACPKDPPARIEEDCAHLISGERIACVP